MGSLVVKKLTLITVLLLVTLLSNGIYARGSQYDYEVFVTYNNLEDERNINESSQSTLGISIYDQPVVYGDYPYLLTNFFERRTHLDFSYTYDDREFSNYERTGDLYKVNYAFASVGSRILFNIGAARLVAEGTDIVGDYDFDAVFYIFGFGYYLTPNAVANVELTAIDYELTDDNDPSQSYDYDETHLEATWRHILKVDVDQYIAWLLTVEAIEIGSSKGSEIGISADYYLNKRVSFGVGYTAVRGEEEIEIVEGDKLTLAASAFMDGRVGFNAEVSRLFADQSDSDRDSFLIKGIFRF